MKQYKKLSKQPRFEGVAPPDTLREDFESLDARTLLRCSYDVEQLLLMQSVEGHAHAGHGLFHGRRFPNTTVDDVARSLRLNPVMVKDERQVLIDEVKEFVDRVIAGEKMSWAANTEGEPLMRCGTLRHIEVDPEGVLKGLYTGGLRDDADIRNLANERYGVEMGYGKCYLVDQRVLRELGMDGYDLARKGHLEEIERFEKAGLFGRNGDGHIAYMYVRMKEGPGASDDAAILIAGKLWGLSAAVGCFLADAIDILEKYVPEYSDQDSGISECIEGHIDLTKDDAVDLAYLCAIPKEMAGKLPDDSLRHMLQIDRKTDQCALESHMAFVAGRPYSPMVLDHGECTNVDLYRYIQKRLREFKER